MKFEFETNRSAKYFLCYSLWVIVMVAGVWGFNNDHRLMAHFIGAMVVIAILIPAAILNSEM